MVARKRYTPQQRRDSVNLVLERLDEYPSVYGACRAMSSELGVGQESLRRWVLNELEPKDEGPGADRTNNGTNGEHYKMAQHVADLEDQVRKLRETNEALKTLYIQEVSAAR